MGEDIPPESPPIEYGNDCLCCFDAGKTPKTIEVTFENVILCPGRSWPNEVNLNRTFSLIQTIGDSCRWAHEFDGNWQIILWGNRDACTRSQLGAHTSVGGAAFYFDSDRVDGVCLNSYENGIELFECDAGHKGRDGTGTVHWPE